MLATLSAYLGHVAPADTYWYLSAVPELMELAASQPRRCGSEVRDERARAYAAGVLHRPADQPASASPNTIAAYRTLPAAARVRARPAGSPPTSLTSPTSTRRSSAAFLDHLERDAATAPGTRNMRLAAIHSLFAYLRCITPSMRRSSSASWRSRRSGPAHLVTYLMEDEVDALLAAPDRPRWTGRRDHALIAARHPDRAADLRARRPQLRRHHARPRRHVRCQGKGRKQPAVPLTSPDQACCGAGSPSEAGTRPTRCSRPAPAGASAATPSRYGSAPTPPLPHSDAPRCPAKGPPHILRHSCAMRCCKQASTRP